MPSLKHTDLKFLKIKNVEQKYPNFVETGTFRGETVFNMEKIFQQLHTIEIKKSFYLEAKNKYKGDKITFYLGDSSKVLSEVTQCLTNNTVFFLDGHWSAGCTGTGKKHVPLYEELIQIIKNFKHQGIIIIDDARLFGIGPSNRKTLCNWEDISEKKILNIVVDRLDTYYYISSPLDKNDRLILHLNKL